MRMHARLNVVARAAPKGVHHGGARHEPTRTRFQQLAKGEGFFLHTASPDPAVRSPSRPESGAFPKKGLQQ